MTKSVAATRPAGHYLSAEAGFAIFLATLIVSITLGTATHLTRTYHTGLATHLAFAAMRARAVEDHLTQNLGVIELTLRGLLESDAADPALELARAARHAPYLRALSLADATGRIVASSNLANIGQAPNFDDSLPPFDAGGDALRFGRPREGRDFHDSRPIPVSGADPAVRTFFATVRDATWRGAAYRLVATINTDYFINHYARNVESEHGAVEVFRYDATLVLSTDERRAPGMIDPDAAAFGSGVPPRMEYGELADARLMDRPTLAAYRASRRFPLVVIVHIPQEYALADWRADRNSVLRLVVPALAIAILLGGATLRHLRRVAAERSRAEHAARAYGQLKILLDTVPANLVLMGPRGEVLLANESWRRFTRETGIGIDHKSSGGEAVSLHPDGFFHGESLRDDRIARAIRVDGEPPQSFDCEEGIATPAGPRWFHIAIRPFRGDDIEGALVMQLDITRRHEAELALARTNRQLNEQVRENEALQALLREQAMRDPLTGLYNRRYLDETAERELARARRAGVSIALAMLDIDHFKRINDAYGHQGGDRVLVELGELLRAQTRAADIACRLGGEEFLLLFPDMPARIAIDCAERLRLAFAALPVRFGELTLRATVSIGLACCPEHAEDLASLVRAADDALYAAKRGGRNRVEVATSLSAPTEGSAWLLGQTDRRQRFAEARSGRPEEPR